MQNLGLPMLGQILSAPLEARIPREEHHCYLVGGMIALNVTEQTAEACAIYLKRLPDEVANMVINDLHNRKPALSEKIAKLWAAA